MSEICGRMARTVADKENSHPYTMTGKTFFDDELVIPAMEFARKLFAFFVAVTLTFGTYALADAQSTQPASGPARNGGGALMGDGSTQLTTTNRDFLVSIARNAKNQIAAAASNQSSFFSSGVAQLSRALNQTIDKLLYPISFSKSLVLSPSISPDSPNFDAGKENANSTARIDTPNSANSTSFDTTHDKSQTARNAASTLRDNAIAENENNDTAKTAISTDTSQPQLVRVVRVEPERIVVVGGVFLKTC